MGRGLKGRKAGGEWKGRKAGGGWGGERRRNERRQAESEGVVECNALRDEDNGCTPLSHPFISQLGEKTFMRNS